MKVTSTIALHSTLKISETVRDRLEAWFQRTTNRIRKWHTEYGLPNSHVTPKLLWGSTVGNPSDSLASCLICSHVSCKAQSVGLAHPTSAVTSDFGNRSITSPLPQADNQTPLCWSCYSLRCTACNHRLVLSRLMATGIPSSFLRFFHERSQNFLLGVH